MAGGNDIYTQVLEDGDRNTVIKWTIVGANKAGDETDTIVFDASVYKTESLYNKLFTIKYSTIGVSARLDWAADTNVLLFSMPGNSTGDFEFTLSESIINNTGTGRTGDITITTNNMNDGDIIDIILWVKEREVPVAR